MVANLKINFILSEKYDKKKQDALKKLTVKAMQDFEDIETNEIDPNDFDKNGKKKP